jgi:hypothetical protein
MASRMVLVGLLSWCASGREEKEKPIEVIVAHYNEDLAWLSKLAKEDPAARDVHFTIYGKGPKELDVSNFGNVLVSVQRLPNVGRESHTYLSHIVKNYENLAKWTVFTQAGEPSFGYKGHSKGGGHLVAGDTFANYLRPQASGSRFVLSSAVHLPSMNHALRGSFCIDDERLEPSLPSCPDDEAQWSDWLDIGMFSDFIMSKVNTQSGLQPMDFYRKYINPKHSSSEVIIPFAQGSRFAVAKEKILSHPKKVYEKLLETLSHNEDPYSGYFMEWLWSELLLGRPAECPLPPHTIATSHSDAMQKLVTRYQRTHKLSAELVRQLASPQVSGVSGISGISGDTTTAPAPSPAPTTTGVSSTTGTTTTAGSTLPATSTSPVSTSSTARVKSVQVVGTVTMKVPNCTAFTKETNSTKAVKDGLRKQFLTSEHETAGVTLEVQLSCSTRRMLSERQLATGDLLAGYTIDVPATATGVSAAAISSSIGSVSKDALTASVTAAVSSYGFSGSYTVQVSDIAAPQLKTIYDNPSTTKALRDSSTRAVAMCNGLVYLASLLLIKGLM